VPSRGARRSFGDQSEQVVVVLIVVLRLRDARARGAATPKRRLTPPRHHVRGAIEHPTASLTEAPEETHGFSARGVVVVRPAAAACVPPVRLVDEAAETTDEDQRQPEASRVLLAIINVDWK